MSDEFKPIYIEHVLAHALMEVLSKILEENDIIVEEIDVQILNDYICAVEKQSDIIFSERYSEYIQEYRKKYSSLLE